MEFSFNALGLSHKFISEHVKEGSFCIDATAGRGRDTLFLCRLCGVKGKVLAFDIQEEAIQSTKELLEKEGVQNAEVILDSHAEMDRYAKEESVDAIMFNFGWLPGGDHTKFSNGKTSCLAIEKGLRLLKKGAVMTLCIYSGKESGYEEKETLLFYLKTLDQNRYSVLLCDFANRKNDPPIAVLIRKEA